MIIKNVERSDGVSRVDKYILRLLPGLKPGLMHKQFRNKNILLNGHKISGNEIVKEGDELKFFFADDTYTAFSKGTNDGALTSLSDKYSDHVKSAVKMYESARTKVNVIYENAHIIIMDKPSDMLSQKSTDRDLSLNEWLMGYLIQSGSVKQEDLIHFKPSVLNRLDRNTSGIVLGSKSNLGANVISKALKERTLSKYYKALVYGRYSKEAKIYTAYLSKNEPTNTVNILTESVYNKLNKPKQEKYSKIQTGISLIKTAYIQGVGDISLLEIDLMTGRSHQIRAHLAALGYPMIGDMKYGNRNINERFNRFISSCDCFKADHSRISQYLHAYKVVFDDQTVKELMLDKDTYISPIPASWNDIISEN